jgi:hypothetical protein
LVCLYEGRIMSESSFSRRHFPLSLGFFALLISLATSTFGWCEENQGSLLPTMKQHKWTSFPNRTFFTTSLCSLSKKHEIETKYFRLSFQAINNG